MKKLPLLALALLFLLAGCGGKTTPPLADIRAEIEGAVTLPAMLELDSVDLTSFTGISAEDYTEVVALVPEEAISGETLFLIRAKDAAAATRIADKLDAYFTAAKNQMRDYIPAEYAKMEKGAVTKTGLVVWLAAVAEQDKVVGIIRKNVK